MAVKPALSIVIPVLNEAEVLPELRKRLSLSLDLLGMPYEVIFVNDGSQDATSMLLRRFYEEDGRWKLIELSRNFSHGAACTAGLDHASGDAVVFMDADLQDPPELIGEFVKKWREGYQVVYAVRTGRAEPWLRRRCTALFYGILALFSNTSLPMNAGIFSLLDRKAAAALKALPERHRYLTGLRGWIGFRQIGVPYFREERFAASPRQTLSRLFGLAMDGIFSFSNIPLRAATVLGFTVSIGSFLLAGRIIYLRLFTLKPIVGWSSIMVTVTMIGGMILLTLGIIGEYIGRMYDELKRRPIYIVHDKLGID